jgi:hypothetical protein
MQVELQSFQTIFFTSFPLKFWIKFYIMSTLMTWKHFTGPWDFFFVEDWNWEFIFQQNETCFETLEFLPLLSIFSWIWLESPLSFFYSQTNRIFVVFVDSKSSVHSNYSSFQFSFPVKFYSQFHFHFICALNMNFNQKNRSLRSKTTGRYFYFYIEEFHSFDHTHLTRLL